MIDIYTVMSPIKMFSGFWLLATLHNLQLRNQWMKFSCGKVCSKKRRKCLGLHPIWMKCRSWCPVSITGTKSRCGPKEGLDKLGTGRSLCNGGLCGRAALKQDRNPGCPAACQPKLVGIRTSAFPLPVYAFFNTCLAELMVIYWWGSRKHLFSGD